MQKAHEPLVVRRPHFQNFHCKLYTLYFIYSSIASLLHTCAVEKRKQVRKTKKFWDSLSPFSVSVRLFLITYETYELRHEATF
jgi:hypothetical protein